MSVINQVLNQLEQRGANLAGGAAMVRPVPFARSTRWLKIALPILVLGMGAGALVWLWPQGNQSKAAATESAQIKSTATASMPEPAIAAAPVEEGLIPVSRLSFELSTVTLPPVRRVTQNNSAANPGAETTGLSEPVKDRAIQLNAPAVTVATPVPAIELPLKQVSKSQQADAEFRRAVAQMQQGRVQDAMAGYEAALQLDAGHDASRQALVALLLEARRSQDAERVLQEGVKIRPEHTGFAMLLARVQVERGAQDEALATLEKSLPHADRHADYQAFFAALLQRKNRHKEAVNHYQVALQLVPNKGVWLMGYGISLQALQRNADAKEAYKRALDTQTLGSDLQAIVQQKFNTL